MNQYIYFRPDGEIIRVSTEQKDIQDEFIVVERAAIANPSIGYVKDGALCGYTLEEIERKQVQPQNGRYAWDNYTMQWVDARSLQELRQDQWVLVKAARDRAEAAGFVWDGSYFDSDPVSQSRIQGAVILAMQALSAGVEFTIDWTLADNTVRTLSAIDMTAVGHALSVHVETQHTIGRTLRAAIEGADTNTVKTMVWPT